MLAPGGRRDDTRLWPRFVQKIAEGKTSYKLGWKVKVMIKKNKCAGGGVPATCDDTVQPLVFVGASGTFTVWCCVVLE